MEEAKIKAYRVQVTDLENGEVLTDTITPACLCVTIANENNVGGQYYASLQGKSELISMKGMMGLAVAAKKEVENFLAENIFAVIKDIYGELTDRWEKDEDD